MKGNQTWTSCWRLLQPTPGTVSPWHRGQWLVAINELQIFTDHAQHTERSVRDDKVVMAVTTGEDLSVRLRLGRRSRKVTCSWALRDRNPKSHP